jgi:hypothetical protein
MNEDEHSKPNCVYYMKKFNTKFTLNRHLETVHLQNGDVIFDGKICKNLIVKVKTICELCKKEFQSNDVL